MQGQANGAAKDQPATHDPHLNRVCVFSSVRVPFDTGGRWCQYCYCGQTCARIGAERRPPIWSLSKQSRGHQCQKGIHFNYSEPKKGVIPKCIATDFSPIGVYVVSDHLHHWWMLSTTYVVPGRAGHPHGGMRRRRQWGRVKNHQLGH